MPKSSVPFLPPTKTKEYVPLEKDECRIFADWCRIKGLMFSHIANEGRPEQMGEKLRIGMDSGIPDYVVCTPKGLVWIEMKRKKGGKVSKNQSDWIEALNKIDGVEAKVCYGAQMAITFVQSFLK